jgi:undecaprenyl-diphosphatase
MAERVAPGLLLIGCCTAFGILVFALLSYAVVHGATTQFDAVARSEIHSLASPALTAVMRFVTGLGSRRFLLPLWAVLAVLFYWRGWTSAVVFLGLSAAGAMALDAALKQLFYRPRPDPFFGIPRPQSYSFPSGHALASFCFYAAMAVLLSRRLRNPAARATIWIAAIGLIVSIGFSRVYLGLHYASDVIAGYAVALVWVAGVAFCDWVMQARRSHAGQRAAR